MTDLVRKRSLAWVQRDLGLVMRAAMTVSWSA